MDHGGGGRGMEEGGGSMEEGEGIMEKGSALEVYEPRKQSERDLDFFCFSSIR